MNSTTFARLARFLVIAGCVLALVSASAEMMNSRLANGEMETYLHAAKMMLAGQNIYSTPSRTPEAGGPFYIYPPLLAALFIPFTILPVSVAIVLWTALNILLLAWIVTAFYEAMTGLPLSSIKFEQRWILLFFALVPTSRFIFNHLLYGQATIVVMAVAVFGLKKIGAGKSASGGLALGASVAMETITYPLAWWFLIKKNLRVVGSAVAGGIVAFLLTSLVVGFARNWNYLTYWFRNIALSLNLNPDKIPLTDNVSFQAQLHRFFGDAVGFTYRGNPHYLTIYRVPPVILLVAAQLLAVVMLLSLIAIYAYKFRNAQNLVSEWGGVALTFSLVPVFAPFAQEHYLVFLLPSFLYIVHIWYAVELHDRWFHELVIASVALLFFTNEAFCGNYLGAVFKGMGCMAWGSLLAGAAIFRAGFCLNAKERWTA